MWVIKLLFYFSSILIFWGTFSILFTKNIVHACVYLLATLLGVAGLYFSLGADFVAATQIVVYVGGMVILMLFAVMLTGGKQNDSHMKKLDRRGIPMAFHMGNKRTFTLATLSSVIFFLSLLKLFGKSLHLQDIDAKIVNEPTISKLGFMLITDHVFSFEVVSILLLGALIGAAVIARPSDQHQQESK